MTNINAVAWEGAMFDVLHVETYSIDLGVTVLAGESIRRYRLRLTEVERFSIAMRQPFNWHDIRTLTVGSARFETGDEEKLSGEIDLHSGRGSARMQVHFGGATWELTDETPAA